MSRGISPAGKSMIVSVAKFSTRINVCRLRFSLTPCVLERFNK